MGHKRALLGQVLADRHALLVERALDEVRPRRVEDFVLLVGLEERLLLVVLRALDPGAIGRPPVQARVAVDSPLKLRLIQG